MIRWKAIALQKVQFHNSPVSVDELEVATNKLVQLSQRQTFAQELHSLKNRGKIPRTSSILSLNPFLDENQIIRVGGRLANANLLHHIKHPILLDHKHRLCELIAPNVHIEQFHCGPQTLLYTMRQSFWPTSGRNLARKIVRACIRCFKVKPPFDAAPIMGNLPAPRLEPNSVFLNVGVDYAGPFSLNANKLRNNKLLKAYIAIFVCLSTKALHLELVTELSTDAFIAAFRRFVSRRGKPANMYSDNGTNFVEANHELENLNSLLKNRDNQGEISTAFSGDKISWHFIPASSPTFGGLWEAGVKLTKHHLRRVLANTHLTYEDFNTVLVQIEAVVNSRPISPLSSDPTDINPLCPAQFLIGRPLTALPDKNYVGKPENRLKQFQRVQQMMQHFWSRWNLEYINLLQTMLKWRQNVHSLLKIGTLVVLKDKNLPPLQLRLARVVQLHPGTDNVVRVASVQTSNGIVKRAVINLCALPIQ